MSCTAADGYDIQSINGLVPPTTSCAAACGWYDYCFRRFIVKTGLSTCHVAHGCRWMMNVLGFCRWTMSVDGFVVVVCGGRCCSALIDCLGKRELFDNLNPGLFSNTTASFHLHLGLFSNTSGSFSLLSGLSSTSVLGERPHQIINQLINPPSTLLANGLTLRLHGLVTVSIKLAALQPLEFLSFGERSI